MLKNITYQFPNSTLSSQEFFKTFTSLIKKLPNYIQDQNLFTLQAIQPKNAFPTTSFTTIDTPFPQIVFDTEEKIILPMKNLDVKNKKTQLNTPNMSLTELYNKLHNHIVRIDHTGYNIPSTLMTKNEWNTLIKKFSKISNIYKYPTGEDWPFILPTTKQEFQTDIKIFPAGREPKFELVYDLYSPTPTMQFDIETDLTRKDVEKLLPEPYGVSFPDLADFFRTVYIAHEWKGLAIRFDIRFKNTTPGGDWETGKWLVEEGGRIFS